MNSLIAVLLDRSSSMDSCANATREGFNTFLAMQQMRRDDCAFYMAQFNMSYYPTHKFVSIFKAAPLDSYSYSTGGGTALWDSIFRIVNELETHIATLPENQRPTNVTCVIQTDGGDGGMSSIEHRNGIKALIQRKTADGWRLMFLGAGEQAYNTGIAAGFDSKWAVMYDPRKASGKVFTDVSTAILEELVAPGSGRGLSV